MQHTRDGSKMRNDLISFIERLMRGEKIKYKDIKSMSIKYHVQKMKRYNLLVTIKANGYAYIAINPDILKV
jgi:hypothetical protein